MIEAITFLLAAQLAGEVIVRLLGVPVPGPVVGLVSLALIMDGAAFRRRCTRPRSCYCAISPCSSCPQASASFGRRTSSADNWLALSVGLVVSTSATLAVTALVFRWAQKRFGGAQRERRPDVKPALGLWVYLVGEPAPLADPDARCLCRRRSASPRRSSGTRSPIR